MTSKLEFLEKLLGKCRYSHNTKEAEFYCPFCFHHKKKLSINVETDQYKCWVCNKAGKNLVYIIKKVGDGRDVQIYLAQFKAKNVHFRFSESTEKDFRVKLPEQYTPLIGCLQSVYGQRAMKYLKRRGVTEDDVLFYKIGVVFDGFLQDRLILPSFNKRGELNFYTTRAIVDMDMNHWSPTVPKGYKAECVFNELNVDWSKPVVLVEGYFDMLKAENAIPLFGSSLTQEFNTFQSIVKGGQPVYLALDGDALKKTHRIGELFSSYNRDVYWIDVAPHKDVGEMTKEVFLEKMKAAIPLTKELIFRHKLRMLCEKW